MLEYRKKAATAAQQPESTPPGHSEHAEIPRYMLLAEKYGLSEDMAIGAAPDADRQTIEEEFQAYIMAPLSPPSIIIVKFWEVRRT
jgi:hypothetical protein